jgi:nitrite reductase/ring-hydroxylating ferredoxin subunit
MSDFSREASARCPYCHGRYSTDDGVCCEPPDDEQEEPMSPADELRDVLIGIARTGIDFPFERKANV